MFVHKTFKFNPNFLLKEPRCLETFRRVKFKSMQGPSLRGTCPPTFGQGGALYLLPLNILYKK